MLLPSSLTQLSNPPKTDPSLPKAFLLWNGAASSRQTTQTPSLSSQLADLNPTSQKPSASEDSNVLIDRVVKQAQQAKQTQLNTESNRIRTQTSKTLIDLVVTEQKPLSQSESLALIKQLTSFSKSRPNEQQITDSLKQILSKPTAYLVKLSLGEKSQWAFSDKPIAVGEKVKVNINAPKIWQAEPQIENSKDSKAIIVQTIRESLPNAKEISTVLRTLENIAKQSGNNADRTGNPKLDLPAPIREAIARVQSFISKPEQLTKSDFLKEAIKNSGGSYEKIFADNYQNKLQFNLSNPQSVSNSSPKNETQTKAIDSFILSLLKRHPRRLKSNLARSNNQSASSSRAATNENNNNHFYNDKKTQSNLNGILKDSTLKSNFLKNDAIKNNIELKISSNRNLEIPENFKASALQQLKSVPNTDFKAQLLILKQLTDAYSKPKESSYPKATDVKLTPTPTEKNNFDIAKALQGALQTVGNSATKDNKSNSTNRSLITQVQRLALSALAKIQLQQAQTLLHSNAQTQEGKPPGILLQLELPIQIDQQIYSINLKIEQDWIDAFAKKNRGDSENNKVKRWQVNLNFDLPNLGQLYARITQIEESTRVQFWAEERETLVKAKNKLSELKNQLQLKGVFVEEISCEVGIPNSQNKTQLSCALVDVCT